MRGRLPEGKCSHWSVHMTALIHSYDSAWKGEGRGQKKTCDSWLLGGATQILTLLTSLMLSEQMIRPMLSIRASVWHCSFCATSATVGSSNRESELSSLLGVVHVWNTTVYVYKECYFSHHQEISALAHVVSQVCTLCASVHLRVRVTRVSNLNLTPWT